MGCVLSFRCVDTTGANRVLFQCVYVSKGEILQLSMSCSCVVPYTTAEVVGFVDISCG
jgi:hypothetical protein